MLVPMCRRFRAWMLTPLLAISGGRGAAELPSGYRGRPFEDAFHKTGTPGIPGLIQCALYDLGGEGVAYYDTDALNNGSGKLNLEKGHQRAHAGEYVWHFRRDEGVDLSFVKDWADLNHTNLVIPPSTNPTSGGPRMASGATTRSTSRAPAPTVSGRSTPSRPTP